MGSMSSLYSDKDTPLTEAQEIRPPPPSPENKEVFENTRVDQMKKIQEEGLELFKKKNADYGDAFANYGPIGVLVRIGDKISRSQNITNRSIHMVDSETIRDTLIDLHNYAAMAIMLIDQGKTDP